MHTGITDSGPYFTLKLGASLEKIEQVARLLYHIVRANRDFAVRLGLA